MIRALRVHSGVQSTTDRNSTRSFSQLAGGGVPHYARGRLYDPLGAIGVYDAGMLSSGFIGHPDSTTSDSGFPAIPAPACCSRAENLHSGNPRDDGSRLRHAPSRDPKNSRPRPEAMQRSDRWHHRVFWYSSALRRFAHKRLNVGTGSLLSRRISTLIRESAAQELSMRDSMRPQQPLESAHSSNSASRKRDHAPGSRAVSSRFDPYCGFRGSRCLFDGGPERAIVAEVSSQ